MTNVHELLENPNSLDEATLAAIRDEINNLTNFFDCIRARFRIMSILGDSEEIPNPDVSSKLQGLGLVLEDRIDSLMNEDYILETMLKIEEICDSERDEVCIKNCIDQGIWLDNFRHSLNGLLERLGELLGGKKREALVKAGVFDLIEERIKFFDTLTGYVSDIFRKVADAPDVAALEFIQLEVDNILASFEGQDALRARKFFEEEEIFVLIEEEKLRLTPKPKEIETPIDEKLQAERRPQEIQPGQRINRWVVCTTPTSSRMRLSLGFSPKGAPTVKIEEITDGFEYLKAGKTYAIEPNMPLGLRLVLLNGFRDDFSFEPVLKSQKNNDLLKRLLLEEGQKLQEAAARTEAEKPDPDRI